MPDPTKVVPGDQPRFRSECPIRRGSRIASVALTACAGGPDTGTTSSGPRRVACQPGAPLDLVYTEYGVTNQGSSWVMGLTPDGREARVVPEDDYAFNPSFSPDGSHVAFISRRHDTGEGASIRPLPHRPQWQE